MPDLSHYFPISNPTLIFFVVLSIILFAPIIMGKLRIPHIVGMVLAGVLVGKYGLDILKRDSSFELFGKVGMYYIMFLAGLEMDMESMRKSKNQFIVFGLLYWVSMARLIRGQILSLREQEYVLSAQATGAKGSWIIRKHLLPNCISVIIISTALQIPNAIFTESFLSFLGLGVNAPMPSLGSLASDALNGITSQRQIRPERYETLWHCWK